MTTLSTHNISTSSWPGMSSAGIVVLGIAVLVSLMCYIYAMNSAVVDSLETQKAEKAISILEEDISRVETDLSRLSIGSGLEERAREQGLVRGGPGRFIPRERAVAQATR